MLLLMLSKLFRYFDCGDKFGLFTPIGKVSKSPMSASRMSTNCAIHKKRSPESMNGSMISSITTNTMSSIPSRVRLGVASLCHKVFCMNFNRF